MFRKLVFVLAAFAIAFATFAGTTSHIGLKPGSYVVAKKGNEIFKLTMDDAGHATEAGKIKIYLPGASPNERISVDQFSLFFSWAKPGKLPEICAINPANGWNLRCVTHTSKLAEMDPVVQPDGARIAYTEISGISKVVTTLRDGTMLMDVAESAAAPAWQQRSPVGYIDLTTARVMPQGATGSWFAYIPDRSGILVQKGDTFYLWPTVGVPSDFATGIKSVAFGPYDPGKTSWAAVVTGDGHLEFWELGDNWLPTGVKVQGPGLSDLSFVTWIEIK